MKRLLECFLSGLHSNSPRESGSVVAPGILAENQMIHTAAATCWPRMVQKRRENSHPYLNTVFPRGEGGGAYGGQRDEY